VSRLEWNKFLPVGKDSSLHFVPLRMTGICIDGGERSEKSVADYVVFIHGSLT